MNAACGGPMRFMIDAICLLVAGVLAVSAYAKRGDRGFAEAIAGMRLVPARHAVPVARLAVTAEVAVLLLLIVTRGGAAGLAAAALLFGCFTAALTVAVRRGARVGCHCFGAGSAPVAGRHVARAGFLCAAALLALTGVLVTGRAPLTGLDAPAVLAVAAAAAVTGAALIWLDDLVWLFRGATPAR